MDLCKYWLVSAFTESINLNCSSAFRSRCHVWFEIVASICLVVVVTAET